MTKSDSCSGDSDTLWTEVRLRLRRECGDAAFRNWIKPLVLVRLSGSAAVIAAPTRFMRDHVATHFGKRVAAAFRLVSGGSIGNLEIIAAGRDERPLTEDDGHERQTAESSGATAGASAGSHPEAFGGPLDARLRFESFVVGQSNELAFASARRVAESDAMSFNPVFIHSRVGLGKTHLMHAIAWAIRHRDPDRRVVYLSAEKFVDQFVRALRSKNTSAFKERFRSVDLLLIDDIQFIGNKEATQEEFFHTFDALVGDNRRVVVSADQAPIDMPGVGERLRSRLGGGLVVDIHPTTYPLRLEILQDKVARTNVAFPPNVMEFLARRITSSVRELEGAVNRLAAHATLAGRAITLDLAEVVLHDLLRASDHSVTIKEIQTEVAKYFQIRVNDLCSSRRERAISRPRQVAMYLAKQLTHHSMPDIGRRFGGRDHATVVYSVRKVDQLRAMDKEFHEIVEYLHRVLKP